MQVENTELIVLEEITYSLTIEGAKALVAEIGDVPQFDPSLGINDPTNALIIRQSKRLNKESASIEKRRKEIKQPALQYGKMVDKIAQQLQSTIEPLKIIWKQSREEIDSFAEKEKQRIFEEEQLAIKQEEARLKAIEDEKIRAEQEEMRLEKEKMRLEQEEMASRLKAIEDKEKALIREEEAIRHKEETRLKAIEDEKIRAEQEQEASRLKTIEDKEEAEYREKLFMNAKTETITQLSLLIHSGAEASYIVDNIIDGKIKNIEWINRMDYVNASKR